MKKVTLFFLQGVIICVGGGVLFALLIAPQFEGRNAEATFFATYFQDPFLAYVYTASLLFFVALYHAFVLLQYVRQERIFSVAAVRAVRIIKYSFLGLTLAILGAGIFIVTTASQEDDPAGFLMLSFLCMVVCLVLTATAHLFEHLLQSGKQHQNSQPTH